MNGDWPPVHHVLLVVGIPAALCLAALALRIWLWRKASAAHAPEAQKPAPSPEPAPRKYTYEEYVRDMEEGILSITEILEKCRAAGGIPKKPEGAPESPVDERLKSRMAWFEQLAKVAPNLKLVPAPPPPPVVVALKGQTVPCQSCMGRGMEAAWPCGGAPPRPQFDNVFNVRKGGKCRSCNGTGFVVITGG